MFDWRCMTRVRAVAVGALATVLFAGVAAAPAHADDDPGTAPVDAYSDTAVYQKLQSWGLPVGKAPVNPDELQRGVCAWRELTGKRATRASLTDTERHLIIDRANTPVFRVPKTLKQTPLIINRVCQTAVYQSRRIVQRVMPVSTSKYRTSNTPQVGTFRIFQIVNGWQMSLGFPSKDGRPNMYRPMYYSGNIALHGARGAVRWFPQSNGCTHTRVADQTWLATKLHIGSSVYVYGDFWRAAVPAFGLRPSTG